MEITLSQELEAFVSTKIESGRYTSPTEVMTEALRLLEEHDHASAADRIAFNQELGRRLEALDQGIYVSPSKARARLRQKAEQSGQAQA